MTYIPVLVMIVLGLLLGYVNEWIRIRFGVAVERFVSLFFTWGQLLAVYWYSDRLVPRLFGAKPVKLSERPDLYGMIQNLAFRAKIPLPKIYLINMELLNAFATGRNPNHASVAVTAGALKILSKRELSAVLGHELAHVKNLDLLKGSILAILLSTLSHFSVPILDWGRQRFGPIVFLAIWFLIKWSQTFFSWWREMAADKEGSAISGDPLALASALEKMAKHTGASRWLPSASHPPIAQRVAALQKIDRETVGGIPLPKIIY